MVKITSVTKNSRAYRAGILAEDILLTINGREISDVLDYRFYVTEKKITLTLDREGSEIEVSIKKDEYETEEEYVGAISDSLNSTLVDNGIELDKALVDDMAQHVADNFGDKENLSDEEIDSIILSYYAAYLENQNSGTLPELPDIPNLPEIPEIPDIPEE